MGTLEMRSRIGSWNRRNATLFQMPSSWPLAAELTEYVYSLSEKRKTGMVLIKIDASGRARAGSRGRGDAL